MSEYIFECMKSAGESKRGAFWCPIRHNKPRIILGLLGAIIVIGLTALTLQQGKPLAPITSISFDVILCTASILAALSFSKEAARRESGREWIPAATAACHNLLTIGNAIERLAGKQNASCERIQPFVEKVDESAKQSISALVKSYCDSCQEQLTTLNRSVENALREWKMFIERNCDEGECEGILRDLNSHERHLKRGVTRGEAPAAQDAVR